MSESLYAPQIDELVEACLEKRRLVRDLRQKFFAAEHDLKDTEDLLKQVLRDVRSAAEMEPEK